MSNLSLSFITLTNQGYLPYTLNCLKSLQKIGITDLKCYAIGQSAYKKLASKQYQAVYIEDELNTNFQIFRRGNWADITFYKFKIIHENLLTNDFVCFTDGDIVFKNPDIFDYCRKKIGDADLLIQNDSQDDNSSKNLCSGFMFIRANENTLKFFDPAYVAANSDRVEGWDDQVYLNEIKSHLNYRVLPLSLFPNGQYFLTGHRDITPYLIHFNWLVSHKKSAQLVKFKECYAIQLWLLYIKEIQIVKYKKALKRRLRNPSLLLPGKHR